MQSIHTDTGKLMESGKSQAELESAEWWDPAVFSVVDSAQSFADWETRRGRFEVWIWVPGLNLFFQNSRGKHAIMKAAKTLFTAERWEEIEDTLEQHGIQRLLLLWDKAKIRSRILRARDLGFLTTVEVQMLNQIFNGS